MERFHRATTVRLRSHHGLYLTANEDEKSVVQKMDGAPLAAQWSVEIGPDSSGFIFLRSHFGHLLTASDRRFLLGATGFKVLQTDCKPSEASVQWQLHRQEGSGPTSVKVRSRLGTFLRANGGIAPYKGSVTHDEPKLHWSWFIWEIQVLDAPVGLQSPNWLPDLLEIQDGGKNMERTIHYQVLDDGGKVDPTGPKGSVSFRGLNSQELAQAIGERAGIPGVILCVEDASRSSKLRKVQSELPPGNRRDMTVYAVRSSSSVARSLG